MSKEKEGESLDSPLCLQFLLYLDLSGTILMRVAPMSAKRSFRICAVSLGFFMVFLLFHSLV